MAHEYTQMSGRAGRRGIDTIGHVVHCNNLFDLPSSMEYSTMLGGKPQSLISKFRISYSLVLNLLKNGKSDLSDYVNFVRNSMVNEELAKSIRFQTDSINKKTVDLEKMKERLSVLRTPLEQCKRFTEINECIQTSVNKKRRALEKERLSLLNEHRYIKEDSVSVKSITHHENDIQLEQDELIYLEHYIEANVKCVCEILIDQHFITNDSDIYSFTKIGEIASSISEIHPLVMSSLIQKWDWFREFSVESIIGLLSCFTNVNISSDIKRFTPYSEYPNMKQYVECLNNEMLRYEELENNAQIYTGIQYVDSIAFDMPDLAIQWCSCETEVECKMFIQNIIGEKGISIGDFTKALLKISTISREISMVAESCNELDCLHKLSQIDSKILKYVTTAQSLYV